LRPGSQIDPRHFSLHRDEGFLGCLIHIMERYIVAKAASKTPPNIKIKVVTIGRPFPLRP
jgi:hypothetical protein